MDENRLRSSILLRMLLIAALTLILLIPAAIVESLINERKERKDSVVGEVSGKWGNLQTVAGPVLTVPMRYTSKNAEGKIITNTSQLHILPDSLFIDGSISTEVRSRGIFQVVLYNAKLSVSGWINTADVPLLSRSAGEPLWNEAFLTVGISDLRGIKENVVLNFGGERLSATSGVRSDDVVNSGISFFPKISGQTKTPFSLTLDLNGSSDLRFVPLGGHTEVSLRSGWNSPSFIGDFLPEQKDVGDAGFSARWKVLELNRNFPQSFTGRNETVTASLFGIRLLQNVDEYQQTYRTAKYALLNIALTFLAFFLCEILSKEHLHPIHYALVGLSLILFYVLVLSLSEHLGFGLAYLLSSLAVLTLVTLYTRAVSSVRGTWIVTGSVIFGLYLFLFIVMQLEDYALLVGSIGLLAGLASVMFLTRKVDWFSFGKNNE